jgi:L-malate glycosyltransferase
MKRKYRLVISNTYGHPNVGDEAILCAMLNTLQSGIDDVQIAVLTQRKEFTSQRYQNIVAVNSQALAGTVDTYRVIQNADLLIVGGGGIIQDVTSVGNLLFHLSRPLMAIHLEIPFVCYALGVGPIQKRLGRNFTKLVLSRALAITVRDRESSDLLRQIGIPQNLVTVTADPALVLPAALEFTSDPLFQKLLRLKKGGKHLIGISLRPFSQESRIFPDRKRHDKGKIFDIMVKTVAYLIDRYDFHAVFFSMHPEQDDDLGKDFLKQLARPAQTTFVSGTLLPSQMLSIIGLTDLMVGMRLHALILAARSSIPVVALSYQPKVAGFLQLIAQEDFLILPDSWEFSNLIRKIESAWNQRQKISQEIDLKLPILQLEAKRNLDMVMSALSGTQVNDI